jgi:hypothetical protein
MRNHSEVAGLEKDVILCCVVRDIAHLKER